MGTPAKTTEPKNVEPKKDTPTPAEEPSLGEKARELANKKSEEIINETLANVEKAVLASASAGKRTATVDFGASDWHKDEFNRDQLTSKLEEQDLCAKFNEAGALVVAWGKKKKTRRTRKTKDGKKDKKDKKDK